MNDACPKSCGAYPSFCSADASRPVPQIHKLTKSCIKRRHSLVEVRRIHNTCLDPSRPRRVRQTIVTFHVIYPL